MSFESDLVKRRKKRLEEEQAKKEAESKEFISEYKDLPYNRLADDDTKENNVFTTYNLSPEQRLVLQMKRQMDEKEEARYNANVQKIKEAEAKAEEEKRKKAEEEALAKSGWFKGSGLFDDGYQVGDVLGTVGSTVGDVVENAFEGLFGLAEGVVDLGAHGVAWGMSAFGNEEGSKRLHDAASKSAYKSYFGGIEDFLDENSVFGDTMDQIPQAVGQIAGIWATAGLAGAAGAGSAATTAITTGVTGASSMGSGVSEAYQGGATDGEAAAYGISKGVIDAGTELIFGGLGKGIKAVGYGKGLTSVDDIAAKKISSKISSTFWKNAAEYGVKATGEGVEELLAGFGTVAAKKLTYMSEEEIGQLLEDEKLLEQFAVGAIASGIVQSGDLVKSNKQGRDFITNRTVNEEAVLNAEYENRVKAAEQDGTKLTEKEKAKIYEQVESDLEKGYISTDTIESALGGETYKAYKDTVDSEEAILKEFKELGNKQSPTLAEQSRYAELQAKVKEIESNSKRSELKTKLSEEVQKQLTRLNDKGEVTQSDNYLLESYNEKARRGQAFEADLSQYDEKTAETIKRAVDSKILNNTRRTHEFVDIIAKISADKGVLFDFTNNERLKESGFALDGKAVNGYVTKDVVTLNIQSQKSWNSVVGHEITHVLEGTELYAELQTAMFEYAKSKKDYDSRRKDLEELYKNVEGADIDGELTADLVGDYLFTDEDFVNNLSVKHRNVFQKIYDEIKYLYKIATAGSKEARDLEKVKRAFDKAYKANVNNNANSTATVAEKASVDELQRQYDDVLRQFNDANKRNDKEAIRSLSEQLSDLNQKLSKAEAEQSFNKNSKDTEGTKYSISDSDGKQLTKEQSDYFKDSKMRDDNGNLMVMYHGSQDAGFHEFDSRYSDDDTSFFFVDRNDVAASYSGTSETYEARTIRTAEDMNNFLAEIGYDSYKAVEKDGKFELLENNEHVAYSDTAQGLYEEFCWYEGVGEGDANYKVYLNLTNPLEVDAEGRNWNNISREFSQEVYDRYKSLTAEEKAALSNLAEWGEYSIFRDEMLEARATAEQGGSGVFDEAYTKNLARAYEKLGGANANLYDAFSIAQENFSEESLKEFAVKQMNTRDYAKKAKAEGYDGVIFKNLVDVGGYGNGSEGASTVAIAFESNQIKSVANEKPTADSDIRYSLSPEGKQPKRYGSYNVYGKDIALEAPMQEDNAPVAETVDNSVDNSVDNAVQPGYDNELFPSEPNLDELYAQQAELEEQINQAGNTLDQEAADTLVQQYNDLIGRIQQKEAEERAMQSERLASLDDADAPPEMEAPYYGESEGVTPSDPFEERDIKEVGNRKVKAYMYENPEVKPFFQAEANALMGELLEGIKGERIYTPVEGGVPGKYGAESYGIWHGTKRHVSADIAYLLDSGKGNGKGYTYAEIKKGLEAIIEDNGEENNACSKRIEFVLHDRLMKGYQDFTFGYEIPPDQDYINLLNEKEIIEYSEEARKSLFETGDEYAPPAADDDIAPIAENSTAANNAPITDIAPSTEQYEAIKPMPEKERTAKMKRADKVNSEEHKTAKILDTEPETENKKSRGWSKFKANFIDKGAVFEDLSLKTKNRELIGKWNHTLSSESRAQWMIGNGTEGVKSLNAIREEVESTGQTKQFYEYLYHKHNVDRMNLESRYEDVKNKPVFGDDVTAETSQSIVSQYENSNPQFKEYAQDVYNYMNHLRNLMVDNGVISQETAALWADMYPHYVPIRRAGDEGLNINVPLDTGRTGINAPVKKATGGNRDILPLFDTMAMRTEQTFRAIARNNFGVELKNTLGSTIESNATSLDEMIDSIDKQEDLLQKGENGKKPTFTVFENGEKVTFEITEDMYDALKPTSEGLKYTNKVANKVTNIHRGLLTEYNPVFTLTNAIKDVQDVLINSQHAAKTYANIPKAFKELATKGKWYTEYMENGGEQNTYFDGQTKTFKAEDEGIKKVIGMPLRAISAANNFVERVPRLAEYIASREAGASVEVAMLDAARVTTNFAAGGDVTKFLNRNGATFLNASIQGATQQVRNIREAKANGLKGWVQLASKFAIAGLSAQLLNHLLWEDDEEYEELSDYVKQNYYVVAKYGDGQFVRIPKGRALAVIQNAFEQVGNAITGDDEVDLKSFLDIAISNLAPNNPVEDNILAPFIQVANNKTWYGEDLVPSRLQDLPAAEQYDESTDAISKWLGEKLNYSPYKINYLLNQYSGGVGDVILPMLTPEAERGDNSLGGNIIAPIKDKFSTDSVMNNQNVSDFYETMDELTTNAKSSKATDEDILKYKYFNSVNSELGELYAKKREIQNSDLDDAEKYEAVREIQQQIDNLAKESLNTYEDVNINGVYASIGDQHFRWYEPGEDSEAGPGWQKITEKQLEKQEEVTSGLGIDASTYWSNKAEYDFAYEYPEKYKFLNDNGVTYKEYQNGSEEFKEAYTWASKNPEKYTMSKAIASDVVTYRRYASELYDIKADKDEDGKSISGSRKEKVIDYINNLDADYGEKIILFKSEYEADDTYNYEIIDYLNSRDDISYEEMATILKELGFTVHSDGTVTWD